MLVSRFYNPKILPNTNKQYAKLNINARHTVFSIINFAFLNPFLIIILLKYLIQTYYQMPFHTHVT